METQEKFEQIKNIVKERKIPDLTLSRVPKLTKEYFLDLAGLEFENDFGMTLKFLCDLHKGYFPTGHEEIEAKIDLLAQEITNLKNQINEKKEQITTLSGRRLK